MFAPIRMISGQWPRALERRLADGRHRYFWPDPRAVLDRDATTEQFRAAMSAFWLGGTFKITGRARHGQGDDLLRRHVDTTRADIVDIGASDGSTSLDLIQSLDSFSSYTVADLFLEVRARETTGIKVFYASDDEPILVVSRRLLAWPQMSRWVGLLVGPVVRHVEKTSRPSRTITLLNPEYTALASRDPRVGYRVHDVFTPWPAGADVIKVANLLRRLYFSDDELVRALDTINQSLRPGGHLLLVDNPRIKGIDERAGLYRKEGQRFVVVEETTHAPEISELVNRVGSASRHS